MMLQLANGLSNAGVSVQLVTVLSTDNTYLSEIEAGVPVVHLRAGRQRYIPGVFYIEAYINLFRELLLNNRVLKSR